GAAGEAGRCDRARTRRNVEGVASERPGDAHPPAGCDPSRTRVVFLNTNRSPIDCRGITMSTYTIDKAHSEVTFQVRHLVTKVRGHFTDFSGTIQFDEAQPEKSSISFSVDTASIDTSAADRDAHLRSDDFFAADKHPAITFTSS